MTAGHGGQILVADSTANQLSGVDLLDLGPRRLRDVPTAVGVFQVQGPGLRSEFPPLRVLDATPFRWAAEADELDIAATIATYGGILGYLVENYEPTTWAEELIEPARATNHARLATLYVLASMCGLAGRIDDATRYRCAAQHIIDSEGGEVLLGFEAILGRTYLISGRPGEWPEWCRNRLAQGHDSRTFTWSSMVMTLAIAGTADESMAAAHGLIEAAEKTRNPHAESFALLALGIAYRDTEPVRALDALRRGLVIAHDNGVRVNESILAMTVGRLEAEHGDPLAALDYVARTLRNYHDAGNTAVICMPLACLAAVLDRLGHYEPAATIAGFAGDAFTTTAFAGIAVTITHLRDVLGDLIYEPLARTGGAMEVSAMAAYAYDQIDQARAELNAVSQ
jgi:hypothetical protein